MKMAKRAAVPHLIALIVAAYPALAFAQLMPPPRLAQPEAGAPAPFTRGTCAERFRFWLPTRMSQEITDCFWQDRASFLNMVVVSGWSDRGSIYSELASAAYVGFRFGFSALVAASTAPSAASTTEANQETAAQRFFAGGGNAILSLAYPLLYGSAGKDAGTYGALLFYPKASTDVPGLGGPAEKAPLNLDTSLELQVRLDRANADLGLFLSGRGGWVFGNGLFYDGLGVARTPFWFSSGTAGVTISHKIQIAAQFVIYADKDLKDRLPSTTINVSLVSTNGK